MEFTSLAQFLPSDIINDIKGIYIPGNKILDKLLWGLSPDVNYTVKSCVNLIQSIIFQTYDPSVFN